MIDISATAPPTYVHTRGDPYAKGEEVQPGFLSILDPSDAKITPPAGLNSTGRRTVLANWLVDPKNPLVARVMVNRIWQYHFGTGIVATPGDFGRMGSRPTHPELLDYLVVVLCRERLEHQEAAPADHAVEYLSAVDRQPGESRRSGSGQQVALAL